METRAATIAKALAKNEKNKLIFFVHDYGQLDELKHDGVICIIYQKRWVRISREAKAKLGVGSYLRRLQWLFSDLNLLWITPLLILYRLLPGIFFPFFWRQNQCDILCCFGVNHQSAEVIADCNRTGIPTILFIASDSDLSVTYHAGAKGLNQYQCPNSLCYFALSNADHIIVQTQAQRKILRERFGRHADVLPNPINNKEGVKLSSEEPEYVLWIGRTDKFHKRPQLCIEVAKLLPEIWFLMILNNTDDQIFQDILKIKPANVEIVERVAFNQMPQYYRKAKLLLSTSSKDFEGFPNTFLQAGCQGVPIVSLEVDPDGILCASGGGVNASGNVNMLIEQLRGLEHDPTIRQEMGRNLKNYVLEHHALDKVVNQVEDILIHAHTTLSRQESMKVTIGSIFQRFKPYTLKNSR